MTAVAHTSKSAIDILQEGMQQAIACHRVGRLAEAAELYQAILTANPKHPDANHNLGVLFVHAKKYDQGIQYLMAALEAEPATAQYWLSCIQALMNANRTDDACHTLAVAREHGLEGVAINALAAQLENTTAKK
jgi:protein O-GlcNAc transferase